MSTIEKQRPVTVPKIKAMKEKGEIISMITCYDYSFARIIDASPCDIVLVGDSLGNVMLGLDKTISVGLEEMTIFTAAVGRGLQRALLVTDMPFLTYSDPASALKSVEKVVKAGANAVKLEGGAHIAEIVRTVDTWGVPVMGHVGLTPQSINKIGGYKVQGKNDKQVDRLKRDVDALQEAGVFSIVFELIQQDIAAELSKNMSVPSIGIGSGPDCDGQVLVLQDMLGMAPESFKHVKKYANLFETLNHSIKQYCEEVKTKKFPTSSHSFQ